MDTVEKLAEKLLSSESNLSTAESCTGGGIGQLLTSLPGSSIWYKGGVVAYSNELKMDFLKVPASELEDFGAVSEEVAASMARGAAHGMNTDLSVSTTGIAGPDGGTADKPVGTVCFGWAVAGNIQTETVYFTGDRERIRQQSIQHSLERLVRLL